jgi:hypothetical protein
LEDAFRHWHKGFRPVADQTHQVMSAVSVQSSFNYPQFGAGLIGY